MSGPLPKPEGLRRRRNRPTHETVVLPSGGRGGRVPKPLVDLEGDAKTLWRRLWSSPAACQWDVSDVAGVTRLVVLACDPACWGKATLLAELRQLEDRFGLSPAARRQLRWQVEEDEEEGPVVAPVRLADRRDPRRALAVDPREMLKDV